MRWLGLRYALIACGLAAALCAASCGSDSADGPDLAVGDNTPRDPRGRLFLQHDDTGPEVGTLRERLVELGANISAADGVFDDETLHVVLQFQRSEGLMPDGVSGTGIYMDNMVRFNGGVG